MSQAQGPDTGGGRPTSADVLLRWASMVPAPPRRPPSGRRPGRRVALILLVVVVAAGLALAATAIVRLFDREPAVGGGALASEAPTPSAPATRTDPGRTGPGVHVQVSPREDGSLDVVEQIRFLGASTGLQVGLPEVRGMAPGALPRAVRITDLEVLSDGQRLPEQEESLSTGGRVLLPNAPLSVELRYRLEGAATMTTRSTPGRALVLLPPIADDDSLTKLPVVIEVAGAGVRNVVCPGLATDDQLCGRKTSSGWRTVSLPTRVTAVLAQLDLKNY